MMTSGLEIGRAVEHLGGEQAPRPAVREDGGDAGPHAGRHQDRRARRAADAAAGQKGAEAGADLGDGPFAAARAAGAERQGAGNDLDQRHARPDLPLAR